MNSHAEKKYLIDKWLAKPIPDFDVLLAQYPVIPLWWNTDLDLDDYLILCEKIKADHEAKLIKGRRK